MAKYIASRLIGTFISDANGSNTTFNFGITGFQVSGGERTMIDITTGANNKRAKFPGLAEALTATINFIYQDEIGDLDAALADCDGGTLSIMTATDAGNCTAAHIIGAEGSPLPVFLTSYSIEAEMDGAVTGTVTFTRDENSVYPSP